MYTRGQKLNCKDKFTPNKDESEFECECNTILKFEVSLNAYPVWKAF